MGEGDGGGARLAWECAVCAAFVGASSLAPLWQRARGRCTGGSGGGSAASAADAKHAFIFAGGSVSTLAMVLSVSRGTLGVRSFLGFPSELVYFGAAMWETLYGLALAFPVVCWLFLPVYFRQQNNSVYEYLQTRFGSRWVRRVAAGTFLARQTLNLAVTARTPCVALHAALGVPHWVSAAALAAAAAACTLLGGLAAAIRADVIQTLTMVGVSAAFIAQATLAAGGPRRVLDAAAAGGRLQLLRATGDPTVRVDTLSAVVGQLFMSVSVYGCQQTFVQRYVALGSEARARRTLLATVPAVALMFSLSWAVGAALYALYRACDPLAAGAIAAPDEVLPYYVHDQFAFLPGMLGLFLGSLFNGALSFMVSNVNSLATVTWEDFASGARVFRGAGARAQLTAIKIIGVLYAVGIAALSLCAGAVGGVVEGSQLVTAATSGALLGAFLLAALAPRAGGRAALAGMLAAHALTAALVAGRLALVRQDKAMLPLSTAGCANETLAASARAGAGPAPRPRAQALPPPQHSAFMQALVWVLSISYMWYAVIGTAVCVAVGAAVAACGAPAGACGPRLLHPAGACGPRLLHPAGACGPRLLHPAGACGPRLLHPAGACGPRLLHPAGACGPRLLPAAGHPHGSNDTSARAEDAATEELPAQPPVTANRVFDAYETTRSHQTRF